MTTPAGTGSAGLEMTPGGRPAVVLGKLGAGDVPEQPRSVAFSCAAVCTLDQPLAQRLDLVAELLVLGLGVDEAAT